MTNYSRTTLRELKKRYLNILKKCLLANLMAFSFMLSAGAEIVTDPIAIDELTQALINPNQSVVLETSGNYDFVFKGDKDYVFTAPNDGFHNGIFSTKSGVSFSLQFYSENPDIWLKFVNGYSENFAGGIGNNWMAGSNYYVKLIFENNKAKNQAGAYSDIGGTTFHKETIFKNNYAEWGGAIHNAWWLGFYGPVSFLYNTCDIQGAAIYNEDKGEILFSDFSEFIGNKSGGNGGAIFTFYPITFEGPVRFIYNRTAWSGGAYVENNKGPLTLKNSFLFASSLANNNGLFRDISFKSSVDVLGDGGTIGTLEGGIQSLANTATFNKLGEGVLVFGDTSHNANFAGTFNQMAGMTIANSEAFFSNENAKNMINGGELRTHGQNIMYNAVIGKNSEKGSVGTLTHLSSSREVTDIDGSKISFAEEDLGAKLVLGAYSNKIQNEEIVLTDTLLSNVVLNTELEKQKEYYSSETSGFNIVTYLDDDGNLVSYRAVDKLFTIPTLANETKAKYNITGSLSNEKGNIIEFKDALVTTSLSELNTGAINRFTNSILDVSDNFRIANKIEANGMSFGSSGTKINLEDVTVVENGLLDIGTKEITTKNLKMEKDSKLQVAISGDKYGKMLAEQIDIGANVILKLVIDENFQDGTYAIFKTDIGNKFHLDHDFQYIITDNKNGSYTILNNTAERIQKNYATTTDEAKALSSIIKKEGHTSAFNALRSEIIDNLKSTDQTKINKAKKALSAVGASEQPSSQSIAASHFNELTRVISQMAMEKEAETVGHSGGDMDPRAKVYIKGLYDRTKSSMGEGFRARSKGAVLGVQSEVTEALTLGVGYATSQTTAKEDLRRTEVDTNTGFISAHYQPNAWWVSGLATFSRGEYEEEKQILSSTGKASYNVDSWGAQVMTGYDIKLENAIITPEVGMRYLSVKQEGYTDTLGTTIGGTQSDYLTALVGVKGAWNMGAVRPTAGVTVGYDIISDDVSALNTLANGASYTVNGEALDRLSTTVTTGIEADLGDRTTLKLEYSGTFRKEYADHSGMLRLEWRF